MARDLARIDRKLEALSAQLERLDRERGAAREADRVVAVVWQNVAAAAYVGFLALDLGFAFARGGVIGLAAETAKKTAEALVFVMVPASATLSEGSVEAYLRELYGVLSRRGARLSWWAPSRSCSDRTLRPSATGAHRREPPRAPRYARAFPRPASRRRARARSASRPPSGC